MRHEDHLGNRGLLKPGGVQWMTAAHGIIHSEMPEQVEGAMRGFQLWVNLPAKNKLAPAGYRDIEPEDVPRLETAGGVKVTVIAGRFDDGQAQQIGAVERPDTEPHYYDLQLPAGGRIAPRLPDGHRVLLYVYEGSLTVEGERPVEIATNRLARLSEEGELSLRSEAGARVLVLAGKPLREPIVQYGPSARKSSRRYATIATVSWPSEPCASRPSGRLFPSACPVLNKVYRSIRRKRSSSARLPIASW